jgi:hypothetical protein
MDYIDYLLIKAAVMICAAFLYNLWLGLRGH